MRKLNWRPPYLDVFTAAEEVDRLKLIVEPAPIAMVPVDSSGRISLIKAQMERLFGYTRQEQLGQPIEVLMSVRFRASYPGYRLSFFQTPVPRVMGEGCDLYELHKDRHGRGNRAEAARRLGISRRTLDRKCLQWGLRP